MDAVDCDSDMEDLRESYSSLQVLTAEMREPGAVEQRDPQRPQNEEWEFKEGRQGLDQIFILASDVATSPYVAPPQVCGQTSGNASAGG